MTARGGTLYYPIWLSYATGLLEQDGHNVRLVDAIARCWDGEQVAADMVDFGPDLIVIESNFSSLDNDIGIANMLKERTGATTAMVGPPVSQFPGKILKSGLDIAIGFEFDFTLRELARAIERGEPLDNVDGISHRNGDELVHNRARPFSTSQELDEIPFVSEVYKRHLDLKDYFLNHTFFPMVQIITSRGCPNQCTFCSWPETLTGRKFRSRSVMNIVDEFEFISRELPEVKEIFIEDDSFTLDKKKVREFCKEMGERDISANWSCQSRATLEYDLMKLMKKAGCRLLDVGYESGSDELLKRMKKGTTTDQLIRFTSDAKRAHLKILADFVIGFHGETKETAEQTIDFIKKVRPDLLQIAVATPIPGTEFFEWCRSNGFLLSDDMSDSIDEKGFQKCIVSYPWLSSTEIEAYVGKALRDYYLSASYVPIALKGVMNRNFLDEMILMWRSSGSFLTNVRSKNKNKGEEDEVVE